MKLFEHGFSIRISVVAVLAGVAFSSSSTCLAAADPVLSHSSSSKQTQTTDAEPFTPGTSNLSLEMGQVFLMGDLGDKYSDAIGTQLHYTYGVSDLFDFDSSLGYSSHSDGQFSMFTALMGLRTNLSFYDKVIPYSIFGLGFYKPYYSYQANGAQDSVSPVLFGVHLGFGVDLLLSRQMFFGASLTLHDVFGQDQQTQAGTIPIGGTFTSFLLHVGYTF
jgi:hypothetical protein